MSELRSQFPAGSYHLIKQNCNHFATALLQRLGFQIPAWVNRLAWWGSLWPFWPDSMGNSQGDTAGGASNAAVSTRYTAFSGGGQTLGGSGASGSATGGNASDAGSIQDRERRAAAIEARLARLAAASNEDKKDM